MNKILELTCTDEQFHSLHEALSKLRDTTKVAYVDKQALVNLLIDHGKLLQQVQHRTNNGDKK
jgi:hypothetical protein